MEVHDLVRMANQIAGFFSAYPHDEAVKETLYHLEHFWDPRMRYQLGTLLRYLYAAIAVIGVWWAVVLIAKPHMSLLPSPLATAQTFIALLATGELERHAAYSVCRVLAACSCAAATSPLPSPNQATRPTSFQRCEVIGFNLPFSTETAATVMCSPPS